MVKPAEHLESPVTLLKPRGVAMTVFLPSAIHEHLRNLAAQNEFHDCTEVDLINDGGSDDAGFVQVIQGKTTDVAKARELDARMEPQVRKLRPDVIGGIVAWHPLNGRFTNLIYFTSEAEARAKEKEMESAEGFREYIGELEAISDGEPKFLDFSDPWMSSR